MRLHALDGVLRPILADCQPVPAERWKPAEAFGHLLASDIVAGTPVPAHAVALREGFALRAVDLVGAAPSSPAILTALPSRIRVGEPLPEGCDCVIDPELVSGARPCIEVVESVAPGTQVRFPGHDLAAGEVIAPAGARIDAATILTCQLADVTHVEVRAPRVAVELSDSDLAGWFTTTLQHLGCRTTGTNDRADLYLRDTREHRPRLAIRPGETGWIEQGDRQIIVGVPTRFDGAIGAYALLVLPVLARLLGAAMQETLLPLTGKIASAIGTSDLVLLQRKGQALTPLATGDIPLRALAGASHFLVIPPGEEGLDAGTTVNAISLTAPFDAELTFR